MTVIYTKESLITKLREIKALGWIKGGRQGNDGSVGNTLEDLLGIKENNLPIPNAAEWELKCQRKNGNSRTTGFHIEPSPTSLKLVPSLLLPKYGWKHKFAGDKYPKDEMSFRMTMNAKARTDRGFGIIVNHIERRIEVSFDANGVDAKHEDWLDSVKKRIGLSEINPQPYWGFDDLFHKVGTKLKNCFYILADSKIENNIEYFFYDKIYKCSNFSQDKLIQAITNGILIAEFDARTGHNHGSKFRFNKGGLIELYKNVEIIED
ncbi:MAG: MvaI/BcnI family restriction endonuclease [Rickettsiales bacterium]|jgi:hypothetical protein|nr:MvaI/BcnI family restriction endonuclease [Rickettsiales bacterium]